MRNAFKLILAACPAVLGFIASAVAANPGTPGWTFEELRRIPAKEARQGVVANDRHIFAISNHAIGRYDRKTGALDASWECEEGKPLIHLNAGFIHGGRLYCSHSNYPGVPMQSSVEIWDTATLKHVESRPLGVTDGSLTWIVRRNDRWLACFVHYAKRGGVPGRGPEWTRLVEFDDQWRPVGGYALPKELIDALAVRGYSCSGGAIGPGGYLYVTGHDEPELYVLEFPNGGSELKWIATIPVTAEGQGLAWDHRDPNIVYMILKSKREMIVGRVSTPK
jgi:hypothetical protein